MSDRSRWTHALCAPCYDAEQPGRDPARFAEDARELERCCRCGALTISGIYYRADPALLGCGGEHQAPVVDPDGPEAVWAWTRDYLAELELRDRRAELAELERMMTLPRLGDWIPPRGWVWTTPDRRELLRIADDAPIPFLLPRPGESGVGEDWQRELEQRIASLRTRRLTAGGWIRALRRIFR